MNDGRAFNPAPILGYIRDVLGALEDAEKKRLMDHRTGRRDLLLTELMATLPLIASGAAASPLNPEQTTIKPPRQASSRQVIRPK
jgi:hypothetical protein